MTELDAEDIAPKRRKGPTLVDVANAAGVSISTAGRVLRDDGWPVEEALKERVLAAAAELSYVPNIMARNLRGGGPALVGLVIGNMLDPYYGEIGETVTRHSETTSQMLVMVCNMQRDPKLELKYCRRLWEHRVSGLILAGGGFDQLSHFDQLSALIAQMEKSGVVVTTLSPRDLAAPCFSVDNFEVGRMAAAELISHGHRHAGVLVGPIQNQVLRRRLDGMKQAFEDADAEYEVVETGLGPSWSGTAISEMFDRNPRITGVVAASSMMSINVVNAIEQTGRSVPDDVSVVGVGGGALWEWNIPRLTHIDLCLDICGKAALDYIATRVGGSDAPSEFTQPPLIVDRQSVATRKA
jgi:LacI family transcriptional regulator